MHPTVEDPKEINQIDIVAMWISFVCLAHCLLMPLVFTLLPFLGNFKGDDWVHKTLVLLALPTSVFALWRSGGWQFAHLTGQAFIGLALLSAAAYVPSLHNYETPISVIGALLLAFVHYKNARLHKCKVSNCAH
jgi:MerC mercury resistance protein